MPFFLPVKRSSAASREPFVFGVDDKDEFEGCFGCIFPCICVCGWFRLIVGEFSEVFVFSCWVVWFLFSREVSWLLLWFHVFLFFRREVLHFSKSKLHSGFGFLKTAKETESSNLFYPGRFEVSTFLPEVYRGCVLLGLQLFEVLEDPQHLFKSNLW